MIDNKPYTTAKPERQYKYWYVTYTTECVLCGRGKTWRERVTDRPRPEDRAERYVYEQYLCGYHYM